MCRGDNLANMLTEEVIVKRQRLEYLCLQFPELFAFFILYFYTLS